MELYPGYFAFATHIPGRLAGSTWRGFLHLHGAIGRGTQTITGCIRRDSSVFLIMEAVVTEILGIDAHKVRDEATGAAMLKFRS